MLINRDPDGKPILTEAMARHAVQNNLHVVHVICDEPGAKVGDPTGVSFLTLTPFVPREGERIHLEDGNVCEVKRVTHVVVRSTDDDGSEIIKLMTNVGAVLIGRINRGTPEK